MGQDIGKNISKSLSGKYSQKLLGHAIKSATDAFKFLQKESFKKQQKQLMLKILVTKLIIKSQKPKQIHKRII